MADEKIEQIVGAVGYNDADFDEAGWENVHEEAPDQIIFNREGDKYLGLYTGSQIIEFEEKKKDGTTENKSFLQLQFRDPEGVKVTNAGYELGEAFKKIPPDSMVRIVLVKFVDVDQASPMKSFRVDVRRGNSAS